MGFLLEMAYFMYMNGNIWTFLSINNEEIHVRNGDLSIKTSTNRDLLGFDGYQWDAKRLLRVRKSCAKRLVSIFLGYPTWQTTGKTIEVLGDVPSIIPFVINRIC